MICDNQVIDLAHGIRRYCEDDIIILESTQGDMSRQAVDTWLTATTQIFREAEASGVILGLFDTSHPNISITPYARARLTDYNKNYDGGGKIYATLLLSATMLYQFTSIFIRGKAGKRQNITYRAFTDRDKALAWLREQINTSSMNA